MICIISSSSKISGAEIVLKDHMINSKHEYILLIPKVKEVEEFFSDIPSVKSIYYLPDYMMQSKNKILSRLKNIMVIIKEAVYIKYLLKTSEFKNIQILYGNNCISCISLGILEKINKEKKYILHVHDMMSSCSFTFLLKMFCRNMKTITVSNKCKEELVEIAKFNPHNIEVIYNGIAEEDFNKIELKNNKTIKIGYAGNIIERKGVVDLATAFKRLYQENFKIELKISYHLKEERYFEKVNNILCNTPYTYETNKREQMNNFYNSIDILVVPSLKDPLPTTVLEAMACGIIVIGSNIDGIPEMLASKYLFEPQNDKSLYDKLKWAILNFQELRKECLYENPKHIKEKFTKKEKVKKMDDYFEKYIQI